MRYPEWLPGKHSSAGKIANLTGFDFTANGQTLAWKRDPLDVFAILVDVPAGVSMLTAKFIYLAPLERDQGRVTVAPAMLSMGWHEVSLYPAGQPVRDIQVNPSLRLPEGWKQASALEPVDGNGSQDVIKFKPVSYETLVDSPLVAGSNYKQVDLGSNVYLDLFGDEPGNLDATDEQLQLHRDLVTQSLKLFGVRHFDHYNFLAASGLSTTVPAKTVCHQITSPIGTSARSTVTFCHMNLCIAGMASIAVVPIWLRQISMNRCRIPCCGFMKARPSFGGAFWPHVQGL